jgi:hypothetical protein
MLPSLRGAEQTERGSGIGLSLMVRIAQTHGASSSPPSPEIRAPHAIASLGCMRISNVRA